MEGYVGKPAHPSVNGPACSECGINKYVKPIMWGYVRLDESLQQDLNDVKLILGGCMMQDYNWYCSTCHKGFEADGPDWDRLLSKTRMQRRFGI